MWKTIRNVVIGVLAVFGVIFIILLLIPTDDEDEAEEAQSTTAEVSVEEAEAEVPASGAANAEGEAEKTDNAAGSGGASQSGKPETQKEEQDERKDDAVGVSEQTFALGGPTNLDIPKDQLSKDTLSFRTMTLDNEEVSQNVFSDYDLTIVHVWGTFCGPCIAEMGEYGDLYRDLPENVNLVGIICDVYDGIDTNVKEAHSILRNADAEFMNLRTSDSVFEVIETFQYVPSSFFVDREGHVVGKMMDGAGIEDTKERLNTNIDLNVIG